MTYASGSYDHGHDDHADYDYEHKGVTTMADQGHADLWLSTAWAMPAEVDVKQIAEDAFQAAYSLIGARLGLEGYPVSGDIAPGEQEQVQRAFELFVHSMALNNPEIAALQDAEEDAHEDAHAARNRDYGHGDRDPNEAENERVATVRVVEFERGPACPDCGSARTTLYPMDEEGHATLYCDDCKREEPHAPALDIAGPSSPLRRPRLRARAIGDWTAYEVMSTDGSDVWGAADGSDSFYSFGAAKAKADEVDGLVYTNDGHDIIYDASGTVDAENLSMMPPTRRYVIRHVYTHEDLAEFDASSSVDALAAYSESQGFADPRETAVELPEEGDYFYLHSEGWLGMVITNYEVLAVPKGGEGDE